MLDDVVVPIYCPILGIELHRNLGGRTAQDASPSLDRLNSDLGYIPGNVHVISYRANTLKNSGSAEEHRKIYEWLEKQP